jgi:hypothetical protein
LKEITYYLLAIFKYIIERHFPTTTAIVQDLMEKSLALILWR